MTLSWMKILRLRLMPKSTNPNFVECFLLDDANNIDQKEYTFLKFSDQRGYVFKKRARAKEE
jgi:hypothetical protein